MINQFSSLKERFDSQYIPVTETGCWLWVGACSSRGYGTIKDHYKTRLAHRVSYEIHNGQLDDKCFICHKCDIPSCVNPNHLYAGNHITNVADKVSRNRQASGRDVAVPRKLSEQDVLEIYNSDCSYSRLEKKYGVSKTTISEIKTGRKWSWLTSQ